LGMYKHGYKFFEYPVNTNYAMPCASFVKEGKDYSIKTGYSESYPFIYFKNAVEKVLQHQGFTLSTDIDTAYFERLAINCNKGFDNLVVGTTPLDYGANYIFNSVTGVQNINPTYISGGGRLVYDANNDYTIYDTNTYLIYLKSNEFIRIKVHNPQGNNVKIGVVLHRNTYTRQLIYETSFSSLERNYNVLANYPDDGVIVAVNIVKFNVNDDISDITFDFTTESIPNSPTYDPINLSSLIEINTQLDLIKMFVNYFALTVNVDNDNKVMHAYTLNRLYDNYEDAKDWSKKLDFGKEQQIEFTFSDYAQSNYIKLQDNEDDNVKKNFEFNITNANLAKRKDLFEMPLCATKTITDLNICLIPMVSKSDDGELSFSGGKLHLLYLYNATYDNYPIKGGSDTFESNNFSNSWQYPLFNTILNEVKYVTAYFNLTDEDIANYDPFYPVYISYFGQYFYINKIVNYVTGKLTKVELLKL